MGSTITSLNSKPRITTESARPISAANQKGAPRFMAARMKNAGSMTNSPWAKLMVCEVCHNSVKPTATIA